MDGWMDIVFSLYRVI